MKARQSAKIRELGQVLIDVGLRSLDDQANALGLPRSTAWTILKTCHKSYGLSAAVIERMLRSSKLPPRARAILVEYVEEKSFGLYGGSRRRQLRFAVRLSNTIASSSGSDETQRGGREEMPWRFDPSWANVSERDGECALLKCGASTAPRLMTPAKVEGRPEL